MTEKPIFFKNLDAIRFFAAMMVFCQHSIAKPFKLLNIDNEFLKRSMNVLFNGGTGVSIFFVLSGFLITFLIITEIQRQGKINIRNFYIRRFLRIWPLYFLVVLISFLILPYLRHWFLDVPLFQCPRLIFHLTFLSNFELINISHTCFGKSDMAQNINWSVSIEEQFYAVWPLIFLLPKRSWIYLILILIVLSIGFRILNSQNEIVLYFHTFSVVIDLAMGALFALSVKKSKSIRMYFENTGSIFHGAMLIVTFLMLHSGLKMILNDQALIYGRIFQSILFGALITGQALTKKSSFLNFGNFNFPSRWGRMTYGIYLLHPIAISLLTILYKTLNIGFYGDFWTYLFFCILAFFLTLTISHFSFYHFENRFLKLKSKFQVIQNQGIIMPEQMDN